MIFRSWLTFTVIVLAVSLYLVVGVTPPDYQAPPGLNSIERYRAAKLLPAADALELSDQIGHEVFDIPEEDFVRQAKLVGSSSKMQAMSMDGTEMQMMTMDSMESNEMTMEMNDTTMDQMGAIEAESMNSAVEEHHSEDGGAMPNAGHTETAEEISIQAAGEKHGEAEEMHEQTAAPGGHGGERNAGITVLAQGSPEEVAMALQGVKIDRTVIITMDEWTYDPMSVNVETGEVVKLLLRHEGSVPHEFMLMDSVGMEVVDYRVERADWNLLEHEAISERPIVMPGDSFELVIKVDEPGMYMYMCMFPKHMEFGMMGMMMAGESMM